MFVQIIQGKTSDPEALRHRFDQWRDQLADGAQGWLGSTGGVTGDGQFVAAVRFESEDAARRNSDRAEQGAWWADTEPLIADARFHDAPEVLTFRGGPDDSAKFVQVIQATVADEDRARSMMDTADSELPDERPDVIGGLVAIHGDRATQVVYFTDEASAREGEAREAAEGDQATQQAMAEAFTDVTYLDLAVPWHHSP